MALLFIWSEADNSKIISNNVEDVVVITYYVPCISLSSPCFAGPLNRVKYVVNVFII